jgi:hypothetical protein
VRESEGGRAALRFSSIQVRDGGHRWHAAWQRGQMGGSGFGILRKEKGPRWAGLAPRAEEGGAGAWHGGGEAVKAVAVLLGA